MEVNSIYEGDNIEILSKFPTNSVDLIYADPPFFTGKNWELIWKDRPEKRALEDRWAGGIEHFIAWMEPRLRECYRILKETGSIYLHCDTHANAHLRILMDKIFGEKNFRNEIIWHYGQRLMHNEKKWNSKYDTILFYAKTEKTKIKNIITTTWTREEISEVRARKIQIDREGREFIWDNRSVSKGYPPKKQYIEDIIKKGKAIDDVWDIPMILSTSSERLGYPTQKPLALLERIVKASSDKGDIVLDPFCGCGTTLVASQKLGRKWIGIDVSPTACKLMFKRMQRECGINPFLIKGQVDLNYVKKLPAFEFQNWVVVDKFLGTVSKTKSSDFGIDGLTPQVTGGYPIQVKQSEDVGRNVVDNFETAMRRLKKSKGYIVAFSFGKGAREEVARVKNQGELNIILRTVSELLEGETEE
jgi:DNA modification methylase